MSGQSEGFGNDKWRVEDDRHNPLAVINIPDEAQPALLLERQALLPSARFPLRSR